jgi:Subtilase family
MQAFPKTLSHPSGGQVTLDESRLLLGFEKPPTPKSLSGALAAAGLALEDDGGGGGRERQKNGRRLFEQINHTDRRFWVRSRRNEPIDDETVASLERELKTRKIGLAWMAPTYRGAEGGANAVFSPLPNVLLVRPGQSDEGSLEQVLQTYGFKENKRKSEFQTPFRYFEATHPERSAYDVRATLLEKANGAFTDVRLEHMPMVVPTTVTPNDPLIAQQWDMTQINAAGAGTSGWNITTGAASTIICILDTGCDLTHPDLSFASNGINLGTMSGTGAPTGNHGTACAGIAAASYNNATGVAGVAGNCRILPVAFQNWTDAEVAAGINWAVANGAAVISMSFGEYAPSDGPGPSGWDFSVIDPAIAAAATAGVVLCAATGNENINTFNRYPARNPLVIACGASDQADNRKSPSSPDGEGWGSNWAPGVSVVAPGVRIPTTDRQGTDGYNSAAGTAGDYFLMFNGTSSATPHVAGFVGLLISQYPTLNAEDVRNVIERTAAKVGTVAYAELTGFANGTRNQEMGYGRIDVLRGLDFGDVMIRDYPTDVGAEPSTPPGGDFWDFSDICIRPTDDNVFAPNNPFQSDRVERGQTNFLYIRATNNGPRDARNVTVDARITPFVGLQFVYPQDWTLIDANHVQPAPVTATFPVIAAGASAMAKFQISSTQVDTLWGWTTSHPWHPCLLAAVTADNDYAYATAPLSGGDVVVRRNNFAQKNLTVVDVIPGLSVAFPFVVAHTLDQTEELELIVDRADIPSRSKVMLDLDASADMFPHAELLRGHIGRPVHDREALVFLDRTRIAVGSGPSPAGVVTLERGSRFDIADPDGYESIDVDGGELVLRGSRRLVQVDDDLGSIHVAKQPGGYLPMAIRLDVDEQAHEGDRFSIRVYQKNRDGEIVGGATAIYTCT